MILTFIILLIAFSLGSVPSGYVIGRLYGIDIREHGSKNIGATNVKRVLGKKAGAYTLIIDILKGVLAVLLLSKLYSCFTNPLDGIELSPFLGLAAVLGHCYSPFLGFNGGKGVATTFGVFALLAPLSTLIAAGVFIIVQKTSGFVSLGSLFAAVSFPIATYLLYSHDNMTTFWIALIISLVIIWRHKENIRRLINKEELKPTKS